MPHTCPLDSENLPTSDQDGFHTLFWSLFLFGMAMQYAYLFEDLRGFALSTAFIYALVALGYWRAATTLPRHAGVFAVTFGAQSVASVLLFLVVALISSGDIGGVSAESVLALQVVLGPLCHVIFELLVLDAAAQNAEAVAAADGEERGAASCCVSALAAAKACARSALKCLNRVVVTSQEAWDVPIDFTYVINRYTGIANLFIICSIIFPLSLLGAEYEKNTSTKAVVLLANSYAILLKVAMLDVKASAHEIHAVLRSRAHAAAWMLVAPLEFLGIALTGVGFVAGVLVAGGDAGSSLDFCRALLCAGPVVTYGTGAALHALHTPTPGAERAHWLKVTALGLSCLGFALPPAFALGLIPTVAVLVATATLVIVSMLSIEYGYSHRVGEAWQWRSPTNQVDFDDQFLKRPPGISSSEEFFTVLLAVAIYQLNEAVTEDDYNSHTFVRYVTRLLIFYSLLDAILWYSCRFSEDDLSHKV